MRGIVSLSCLRVLEEKTGRRIHELFDLICGTSTGTAIAVMLGIWKMTIDEVEEMYETARKEQLRGRHVSVPVMLWRFLLRGHGYDAGRAEAFMRSHFGTAKAMEVSTHPRVFSMAAQVSNHVPSPFLFRNYTVPSHLPDGTPVLDGTNDWECWQAVRASAAAPLFLPPAHFDSIEGKFLDGALVAYSPIIPALAEARTIWGTDRKIGCVVSVGTGELPDGKARHHKYGLLNLMEVKQLARVGNSLFRQNNINPYLEIVLGRDTFYRFSPTSLGGIATAERKRKNWEAMRRGSLTHMFENSARVDALVEKLTREETL